MKKIIGSKIFKTILSGALVLSMTACGGTNTDPVVNPSDDGGQAQTTDGPINLTFAAQEVGTAGYNYAAALQGVMLEGLPEGSSINITTSSPGGVGAPVIVNNAAQTDIVMSNSAPAKWSMEEGILGQDPTTEIASLGGGLGHDFVNVMFTQSFVDKTGITTLEQLVEEQYPVKIIIKTPGTLGELSATKVFEALGVSIDDVADWGGTVERTGGDAIKSGLQDSLYDLTIDHIGAGQSNTTELCLTTNMYSVQLGDETLSNLVDMGYDYITIEENTWGGQSTAIASVGSQQCILVSTTMDEEVAYNLTKAVAEGKEALGNQVAAMSYFDPEVAGSLRFTGVPLHPGARRYYEEMGYEVN